MTILPALLQTWHELDFSLGRPEDIDAFPFSAPVALLVMLGMVYFLRKARRNYLALPKLPVAPSNSSAGVTVIIPARNEEKDIEACIRSFQGVRVVVADDESTDGTAAVARTAGAEVIQAPPLPKGAMGKPNACHAGSRNATTDYLLFTDADTRYAPEFAPSIVRFAEQNQCVLVSAFLRQRLSTPFEHILLPYAQGLYFCGVNARRIHDVAFQDVLVNGQCMLFQRTAYEFLGGHMVVNNCVIEDMVLAAKLKRHQMKMILLRAEHLGSVRMYGSFSAISRAFQKNSFRFLMMNKRAGFQVLAASVLLAAYLPLAAWLAWEDQWFVLIMHALLPLYLMAPWYGGVVKAVLSIAAMYLFPLLSLHAVLRSTFSRKTLWKGRPV